jgi:hypothetical protein
VFESESNRKCENKYNIGDIHPYPVYLHPTGLNAIYVKRFSQVSIDPP